MNLVAGAVGSIITKLGEVLHGEYKLQKGLQGQIEYLKNELESAHTALCKVGEMPPEHLDPLVRLWAGNVREASYDMEDILDIFLINVMDGAAPAENKSKKHLLKCLEKMVRLLKKSMARHHIAGKIENMKKLLQEVSDRRDRYSIPVAVAAPATKLDPRLVDMHKEAAQIIGIERTRAELIAMLKPSTHGHGDASASSTSNPSKIVSVVGAAGLGKTTLAKAVYDQLSSGYDCQAFVSVGRNPDLVQVFTNIFFQVDKEEYKAICETKDPQMLIDDLQKFLENKRYFIVIDDVWDINSWQALESVLHQNNNGSRVVKTTRNLEVACGDEVYKLGPLSHGNSKKLFYIRLYGGEGKCPAHHPEEASQKILDKCGGVPLAIITMASLLVGKSREDWFRVCNSPGFYRDRENKQVDDTVRILALSYYDLPAHLKTCLVYLCGFPENFVIKKDNLIWKWIAEGFIPESQGIRLSERGEGYFLDLLNRSIIQAVTIKGTDHVYGCRVGGMVYDLIHSLPREENFVCVLDEEDQIYGSERIRWLAIQNSDQKRSLTDSSIMGLKQLRSLTAVGCPIYMIPPVLSFILLRVLDLESCGSMEAYDHEHIGELLHLRFLGLRNTLIRKLPESIGRLKFLQTLELEGSGVQELPESMDKLARLMFLNADWTTRVPDCIGMLTSLEQLVIYPGCCGDDDYSARCFIKGLGNLTELRELRFMIKADDEKQLRDLLQSLSNLRNIEVIHFDFYGVQLKRGVQFEPADFVLSYNLRFLELSGFEFSSLPSWINVEHLGRLCHLSLMLFDVNEQDLEKLGEFPMLRRLHLQIMNNERTDAITCASGGFLSLRSFSITKLPTFLPGTMPRLEVLDFHLSVRLQPGSNSGLDFYFGLENLPSLRQVNVHINCLEAIHEKVEKTEAAVLEAVSIHPNHPILQISLSRRELEKVDNDGANDVSNSNKGKGVEVAEEPSNSVSYTKSLSVARDGIDEPVNEIIKMISVVDNEANNKKIKIVPIVRSEGRKLKTTLAQKVFDKLRPQFDCAAFVLVGQNPDMRKVFTDILIGLDNQKYQDLHMTILHLVELVGLVRKSVINKRFFVVVDDIWDLKAWDIIKSALIGNSNGSAILATSPNIEITISIGGGKQLLSLSKADCKKIFCKKLFGSETKCPPHLENICDNLIQTCGGMLAVIDEIVTSLETKSPTVKEWQAVYDRRKLALSYPKLPEYLKKSLLYFSLFPKGYEINAECLVWAWIAEDFVKGTQGPRDLQKLRRNYLSELIKENMIEAVEVDADGMALSCRAYDWVHDFIVTKSTEENLVAILNDSSEEEEKKNPNDPEDRALSTTVDRLSIQGNHSQQKAWFSKVKSLVAACDSLPPISWFMDLRVMDLSGCDSLQACHLKDIKKTISLKYLAIGGKYIAGIPKDITKLTDLLTLDLSASGLNVLPKSVFSLRKLVRLRVSSHMKIPGGIEEMSALQELGDINIVKPELLKRLCKLRKLRILRIALWSWDEGFKSSAKLWWDTLLSLVGFFKNIESLFVLTFCSLDFMDGSGDKWPPHQTLKQLEIRHSAFHDKLPSWFNSLCNISSLAIEVNKLSENILSTLGNLSALCSLSLTSKEVPKVYFVINSDTFKKLECLKFVCNAMLVEMFQELEPNASQQLKRLTIVFQASRTKDINKDFRFGLDNLRSLEHVRVEINCFNASHQMVKNAEVAIRNEMSRAGSGSSQPNLEIRRLEEENIIEEDQAIVHQSTMQTIQAEPVVVRQAPMSSTEIFSNKVRYHISNNIFLKNVGIVMSSTKIEKSKERMLQKKQTAEQQCSTALRHEVDKLKQSLANTQREFEEFKKQMEEQNVLLKRILHLNSTGVAARS